MLFSCSFLSLSTQPKTRRLPRSPSAAASAIISKNAWLRPFVYFETKLHRPNPHREKRRSRKKGKERQKFSRNGGTAAIAWPRRNATIVPSRLACVGGGGVVMSSCVNWRKSSGRDEFERQIFARCLIFMIWWNGCSCGGLKILKNDSVTAITHKQIVNFCRNVEGIFKYGFAWLGWWIGLHVLLRILILKNLCWSFSMHGYNLFRKTCNTLKNIELWELNIPIISEQKRMNCWLHNLPFSTMLISYCIFNTRQQK